MPTGTFPPVNPIQVFIPPLNSSHSLESLLDRSVNIPYHSELVDKLRGSQYPHQYSRFRCIGDDNSDVSSADRACVFMNLCYDRYTETFNYYRRNKRPILYDAYKGLIYDFKSYPHGFLFLTYFESHAWAPYVVEGTLPVLDVTYVKRLHVLFRHWIPLYMNLGHFLWEDLQGAYNAVVRLGLGDLDPIIMDVNGFDTNGLFNKFKAFFTGISSDPMVDFKTYIDSPEMNQTRYICFEQLQAGGAVGVFQREHRMNNHGKEAIFRQFRDNILRRHEIDPEYVPTKHRIAITRKTNPTFKRDIKNLDEVVLFLKTTYPTIEIVVVEFAAMSIKEQLQLMINTTIFITPCGGVSMMAPFLPIGAHALFMDFFVTDPMYGFDKDTSGSMEGAFWNHWAHFKRNYYQVRVEGEDYAFDYANAKDARWYASIIVKTARLKELVDGFLEDMEA